MTRLKFYLLLIIGFLGAFFPAAAATNIDFDNRWAWNDLIGWIDFYVTNSVTVWGDRLDGYANSSVGEIVLNCNSTPIGNICATSNFKVTNDGNGNLGGWAWNDAIGWISFNCADTVNGCLGSNYKITIDSNGNFAGWAWNDAIGWISFNCTNTGTCIQSNYKVNTSWRSGAISGQLISSVIDTKSQSVLNSLRWEGFLPTGAAVRFQIASTVSSPTGPWNYIGSDGTSNSFYQPVGPGAPIAVGRSYHNNHRYFRYKIILISDALQLNSPRVDEIIINWSP